MAAEVKVDVNIMPRILFTGDSQTCGCVGAMDYAQMMSWEIPLRVFNRAVGGSNTSHLLGEFGGGTITVKAGEKIVHGEKVGWYAGPYIGQKVRIGTQQYTVDAIETLDYKERICKLHLTEPAREDYSGRDYKFEEGWRVRVADVKPQIACFMYTVNDAGRTPEDFKAQLAEITRRCREAGIQPVFISGVPFMDAPAGGSHPGTVSKTMQRARDLEEFCREQKLPYGDVFRTLDLLDPQRTCVWADTIHPTNDGSIIPIHALRYLLKETGALDNPYYVHGHTAQGPDLPDMTDGAWMHPFATAQPRRDKNDRLDQKGHDLEAQRLRDHYGLIAEADGQALESKTPVVLSFGVGEAGKLEGAVAEVVVAKAAEALVFSYRERKWLPLGPVDGRATLPLPAPVADLVRDSEIKIGLRGADGVAVDYAALTLTGDVQPWQLPTSDRAIMWPTPGQFDWSQDGNLFPNADLTQAAGDAPAGWTPQGEGARYLLQQTLASGTGEFPEKNTDRFKSPGAKFTQTVRPLDMLVIKADLEGGPNFLVERVMDDETLDLRRAPKAELGSVEFEVQRSSGLRAVPNAAVIEAANGSQWSAVIPVEPGQYRLGFFYRVFDPANMNAVNTPGRVAQVVVSDGQGKELARSGKLDCSYVWLRGWVDVEAPQDGKLTVTCGYAGDGATKTEAVQYTGFSLQKR